MSQRNITYSPMKERTLISDGSSLFKLRSLMDGLEYPLDNDEVLVGREVECQITLNSTHISRYHAKILVSPKGITVEDLRSTNGTFINGRRITVPETLSVGDEVRFHELPFRLVSAKEDSGQAEETAFFDLRESTQIASRTAPKVGRSHDPAPYPVSTSPSRPRLEPEPFLEEEEESREHTKVLSLEELHRLQGKAERQRSSVDNGSGPRIVVLSAPIRGKVFSFGSTSQNTWLIGRDTHCDFPIADRTVSSSHARIRRLGDEWVLEACEGTNPIFINNKEVEFSTLHPGDAIRIGRMEMMFRIDERSFIHQPDPETADTTPISRLNFGLLVGAVLAFSAILIYFAI